jgi:hypothetical protein
LEKYNELSTERQVNEKEKSKGEREKIIGDYIQKKNYSPGNPLQIISYCRRYNLVC